MGCLFDIDDDRKTVVRSLERILGKGKIMFRRTARKVGILQMRNNLVTVLDLNVSPNWYSLISDSCPKTDFLAAFYRVGEHIQILNKERTDPA
jgi:hypothetical protein